MNEGLILESTKGNLRLFRLNRDDFAVRELTRAYYLLKLKHLGIDAWLLAAHLSRSTAASPEGISTSEAILIFC